MYQHLFVPLDGTELSMANVGAAVQLAQALGARITFFHATPDFEGARREAQGQGHMEGARLGVGPSAQFEQETLAAARAIMAKACAAAAAAGVAHASLLASNDRPAQAIVQAARDSGCDLIVMASHGVGGLRSLIKPSQASRVMRGANIPVLITRVQANDKHAQASRAVALIHDEHRSLAAVIQGMSRLVDDARAHPDSAFDRDAFERMLRYLVEFPVKRHHPKEESSLHRLLRERGAQGRTLMETLEAQHLDEYELVAVLHKACNACAPGTRAGSAAFDALAAALGDLSAHVWEHMRLEESTLIPLALQVLNEEDWKEVARVFEGNQDPGYGAWSDEEFRRHFASIADQMDLPATSAKT
jgi:nucleotide-binding universal stress UspA family protein/hemerythrin-like domain-containing protein